MSGDGSPSWPIIQLLAANTPPGFSTRKISRKIASLSGTCSSASLEKTTSKTPSANGSGPGGACTKSARSDRPRLCARRRAAAMTGPLDVEAGHMSGAVLVDQMQRDAAGAAADVEHAGCRRAPGRRRRGRLPPARPATDSPRPTAPPGSGSPCRHTRPDRRRLRSPDARSPNRQVPAQSLAHQQENATVFVEHSFNMAGQKRLASCEICGEGDGRQAR